MFYSLRSKLIASFLGVSFLVGAVSLLVGGRLLYNAVLTEAETRVSYNLNVAREFYATRVKNIETVFSVAAQSHGLRTGLKGRDASKLVGLLRDVAQRIELDFAGVATPDGLTLCRLGPPPIPKEGPQPANPLVKAALNKMSSIAGTISVTRDFLFAENPELAASARIKIVPTPLAASEAEGDIVSGMVLGVGIPVFDEGVLLGVLYGGVVLNNNRSIVDAIRDTVFQEETYEGRPLGTATIFYKDVRIATNVLTSDGKRAIGTRASKDVKERVYDRGLTWKKRAFVVSDEYISAYEPIEDIFGSRVGMLYVGLLEAKYEEVRQRALAVFIVMTVAGVSLAIGLGYLLAYMIMRPVRRLIQASAQVSRGDFSPDIGPVSKGEIGVLQAMFKEMLSSLRDRDRRIKAEGEIKLLQSEKQASIGRLAGGVAHEINNPLTGVLTYVYLLLRRKDLGDDIRADLEAIAQQTERVRKIVKNLLDFSRQTELTPEPTDINRLVRAVVYWVKSQALVKGVTLTFQAGEGLPELTLDRTQMQSVVLNLLINALDATTQGDSITVTTGLGMSDIGGGQTGIETSVQDTGCGIAPENMDRLFDPFFTTKEVGQGTGLGLSVSYGIVQRHGGTIRVQSEVAHGSTFTIWLPVRAQGEGSEENPDR